MSAGNSFSNAKRGSASNSQCENVGTPVSNTLAHVDEVTRSIEETVGTLSRTADLTKSAVTPAIINIGAAIGGISAGLRRLVTGKTK